MRSLWHARAFGLVSLALLLAGCAGENTGIPAATAASVTDTPRVDREHWDAELSTTTQVGQEVRVATFDGVRGVSCEDFELVLPEETGRAFANHGCDGSSFRLVLVEPSALFDRSELVTTRRALPPPVVVRRERTEPRPVVARGPKQCGGEVRPYLLGAGTDVTFLTPGRFELRTSAAPPGMPTTYEYKNDHGAPVQTALADVLARVEPLSARGVWRLTSEAAAEFVAAPYEVYDTVEQRVVLTDRAVLSCDGHVAPAQAPLVMSSPAYSIHAHFDACDGRTSPCILRAAPGSADLLTQVYVSHKHGGGAVHSQTWNVTVPPAGVRVQQPSFLPSTIFYGLGLVGASSALAISGGLVDGDAKKPRVADVLWIAAGAALVVGTVLMCLGPTSITRRPTTTPLHARIF